MDKQFDVDDAKEIDDPLVENLPAQEDWYYPTIVFDRENERNLFEHIILERRKQLLQADASEASQFVQDSIETKLGAIEDIIDRMGQAVADDADVELQTPNELNQTIFALTHYYALVESAEIDSEKREKLLSVVMDLLAKLVEAHWADDTRIYDCLTDLPYLNGMKKP